MPNFSLSNMKIYVEVPLLLVFFAFLFTDSVTTNLIIYRSCYLLLGFNETECALLGKSSDAETAKLEKLVEPTAAVINMVRGTTESCVTAFLCLFVGPWSDRFGRKPLLVLPLLGYTLAFSISAILSYFPNVSPWYFMISTIPVMMTGGTSSYLTGVLSYIADVTLEANRGLRMGVFEAVLATGILLGNLSSSYVLYATSYAGMYAMSSSCCLVAALLSIFFISESIDSRETEGKFRGFFSIRNVIDMFKTVIKPRENYNRAILMCSVLILTLYIFGINGEITLSFLYLREKFKWSLRHYTLYSSAHNIVWIFGTISGVYLLHKVLKITETVLILVGFLSVINGVLMQGLATQDWHIYAAGGVRVLGGMISPMVRSLVSKTVPSEEIGKIFSAIISSESIFGLLSAPLFTAIYNSTINTNPGSYNFVLATLYFLAVVVNMFVIFLQVKTSVAPYNILASEMRDADEDEELINEVA